MVYTKETTTHSNRRSHTQLFAKYLFIYNLVPRYGLGINLHVRVLANQNKTIIANTVDLLFRRWTNWVNFVFVCLFFQIFNKTFHNQFQSNNFTITANKTAKEDYRQKKFFSAPNSPIASTVDRDRTHAY